MTYETQTWIDGAGGGTPISAARLNHIEQGLADIDNAAADIKAAVDSIKASLDSGTGTARVQVLTTAQRVLLAAAEGDMVWDTTVDALVTIVGGTWQKADGTAVSGAGGANAPLNMASEVVSGGTIGQINLTWDPPSSGTVTSYKLYEVQSPTGVSGASALGTTSTTRTPSAPRTYEYWVTALISGTESAASNHTFATLPYVAPGGGGTGAGSPAELLNINGLGAATGGWWNLGVGKDSGHVDIDPTALKTYSEVPYFYINGSKVHFQTDCAGGRTSTNTKYPRSELREYATGSTSTKAAWSGSSGNHRMKVDVTVTALHVSVKPELCIFQIHDASDDTLQVIAQASNGSTTSNWVLKVNGTAVGTLVSSVALGDEHTIDATVNSGTLTVKLDGVTKYTANPGYGSGQYFKHGAYLQANNRDQANAATDYMSCESRNLLVTHS